MIDRQSQSIDTQIMLFVLLFSLASQVLAQKRPLTNADTGEGKILHTEHQCSRCHEQRTGKNESAFYTRLERKVTTQEQLISQIAYCSAQLNLRLFPEDEINMAAYLNHVYYKLK